MPTGSQFSLCALVSGERIFFELTDADDAIAIFAQIRDIAKFFTFDFLLPARQQ